MTNQFQIIPKLLRLGCFLLIFCLSPYSLSKEEKTLSTDSNISKVEWREKFLADFRIIQQKIRETHPAMFDTNWPEFAQKASIGEDFWNSWKIEDEIAYLWALKYYVNSLNDPHTSLQSNGLIKYENWSGYFIAYDGTKFVVDYPIPEPRDYHRYAFIPPLRSELIQCQGKTPFDLIQEHVISFHRSLGSNIQASKLKFAPYLFIRTNNPFVSWPIECEFMHPDGTKKIYEMKSIELSEYYFNMWVKILTGQAFQKKIDYYLPNSDTIWLSYHDFSWYEDRGEISQDILNRISIDTKKGNLNSIEKIVIDMRGNFGGLYDPMNFDALFGQNSFFYLAQDNFVKWPRRPSPYLLNMRAEQIKSIKDAGGDASSLELEYEKLEKAYKAGVHLLYDEKEYPPIDFKNTNFKLINGITPRLYVIIDRRCTSSCLVFVDGLANYPNVKFVGEVSGYDQPFMPIGPAIPIGNLNLVVPFAFAEGRKRGYNESYIPDIEVNPLDLNGMTDNKLLNIIENSQ